MSNFIALIADTSLSGAVKVVGSSQEHINALDVDLRGRRNGTFDC